MKNEFKLSDSKINMTILEWFECNLFHEKTPILTEKKILDEEGKQQWEIVHVCQKCNKKGNGMHDGLQ
jgi:hypothetical protein